MKRNLFEGVMVLPYKSGDVIDREGYLSAVVGAIVGSGASMTLTVEHSDDGETFVAVADERVFPEKLTKDGKFVFGEPAASEDGAKGGDEDKGDGKDESKDDEEAVDTTGVVNVDVDLLGLKQFVKFTVVGSDSLAVVLGDSRAQPV